MTATSREITDGGYVNVKMETDSCMNDMISYDNRTIAELFRNTMPDFNIRETGTGLDITKCAYEMAVSYGDELPTPKKKCIRHIISWEDALIMTRFSQIEELAAQLRKKLEDYKG